MRVERKRPVESERRAVGEEATRMEDERQATVMKSERQVAAVELSFHISDWLQIGFKFILYWWSEKS